MSLQQNEIHENYVFSGFYRTPLSLRVQECSYSVGCPHRMQFEFCMENLRNFLFIFQYNFCSALLRFECHQLHKYMANQMNILAELRFSKCRFHEARLCQWKTKNATNTLVFMRRVHFRDTCF